MSSNPILSNINAIAPQGNQLGGAVEAFDLSDDAFAKILDRQMGDVDEDMQTMPDNVIGTIGMPIGLHIEGINYEDLVSTTDRIESVNADSNIKDGKFNLPSFVKDAVDAFTPVVDSVLHNGISSDLVTTTASSVKSFLMNQAQNVYAKMNKENVDDIAELISKL